MINYPQNSWWPLNFGRESSAADHSTTYKLYSTSSKAAKCVKVQLLLFRQAAMSGKGNNLMFLSFFFNKGSLNIFIALFFSNFSFTSMHTSEANT